MTHLIKNGIHEDLCIQIHIIYGDIHLGVLDILRSIPSSMSSSEKIIGHPWLWIYDKGPHNPFIATSKLEQQIRALYFVIPTLGPSKWRVLNSYPCLVHHHRSDICERAGGFACLYEEFYLSKMKAKLTKNII